MIGMRKNNDHLPPHFHAEYGEFEAVYTIDTLDTLRGQLPRRAHAMTVYYNLKPAWVEESEGVQA